jgi:predicted nuclease with TOPRIM domain
VDQLTERVDQLTVRMDQLTVRMDQLTVRMDQLTEQVDKLAEGIQGLKNQVGGLSDTVGGDIEDIAYIVLHEVLKRELGWEVSPLERSWQKWDGTEQEIDIFGPARDPARPEVKIWIVGEAKHNLTLKQVERFGELVARAQEHLKGEVFAVCFCYRARPEVQKVIKDAGYKLVFSYGKMI